MIEEGRHKRPIIPREERYCPHCPNVVESETHFLTSCTAYRRDILFNKLTESFPQFAQLDDKNKFILNYLGVYVSPSSSSK